MIAYTITGRLTRDAEMKTNTKGWTAQKFTIAVNLEDKTSKFYTCYWGGERANRLSDFLTKGRMVMVIGTPKWTEYNGKTYENIYVEHFEFVGNGKSDERKDEPKYESDKGYDYNNKYGHTYPYTQDGITFQNEDEYDKYLWDGTKPGSEQKGPESFNDDYIPF